MTIVDTNTAAEKRLGRLGLSLVSIFAAAIITIALTRWAAAWALYPSIVVTFLATLAAIIVALEVRTISVAATSIANSLAGFLYRRKVFSSDTVAEAPKFALLRIAFGLLMAQRAWLILWYFGDSDWANPLVTTAAVGDLIAAGLISIGLLTQFAFAFLMLIQWQLSEVILGTSTLGNDIAAILSLLLMFANAGAHLSADRALMGRGGIAGRFISLFYYRYGLPPNNALQIAKLLAIFSYWCVCVYSLMQHLSEPAWMSGTAGIHLLTSQFLSQHSTFFVALFSLGPWAVLLGRLSLWAMLPWYILFLPFLLLGGLFRAYVIVWSVLFFTLSLFFLQLGWLAHFEFILLLALFWEKRFIVGSKSLLIAYDDRCNLCDRTAQFIKRVDIFKGVSLCPLSKNAELLASHMISEDDALRDLYGIDAEKEDRITKGYDFYLTLSRRVLLLWPIFPVLLIGRFLRIGPAIYSFIAEHRIRAFGVCQIPSKKADYTYAPTNYTTPLQVNRGDPLIATALHVAILGAIYLICIPAPFIGWTGAGPAFPKTSQYLTRAAHIYGVAPINVFNRTDLKLSENWYTISMLTAKNERLLPIFSNEGGRLGMHASDRIYFGYTLRFARGSIGSTGCLFDKYHVSLDYLTNIFRAANPNAKFIYRQYHRPLASDASIFNGGFKYMPKSLICSVQF